MGIFSAVSGAIRGSGFKNARIETPRLLMRPPVFPDRDALSRNLSNPAISRWLARVPNPYTTTDAHSFIEHARLTAVQGTALTFSITLRGDPWVAIGIIACHSLDSAPEFGYWLAEKHWGKGLMTEAAEAVLDFLLDCNPPDHIASGAFFGNEASLAIQRRLGFQIVGESERDCSQFDRPLRHVDTSLSMADYRFARAMRRPRPA